MPNHCRLPGLLACFVLVAAVFTLPVHAVDYDTALDRLSGLQKLAQSYLEETGSDADPIELTLSYTRTGPYNSEIWTITAGARDPEFEDYVAIEAPELTVLQDIGTVETPGGSVDFAHLLASLNLVYRGLPITGSWGGDCMELAAQYEGQAQDAQGYAQLMADSFASEDSTFGGADLRADLDSILIGAQLGSQSDLAELIRSYYSELQEEDRARRFIALSFGTVDTGDTEAFRQRVYQTMTGDAGMQLLLFLNGMMSVEDGWTVSADRVPALQGACSVFADYLAGAVNGERVSGDTGTRMVTMADQALSDALAAMGYQDAADAVLAAGGTATSGPASSQASSSSVSSVLSGAASTIQSGFNLQVFETLLLVLGCGAAMLLLICVVMLVRRR